MNIHDFIRMKQTQKKITMVTCYDYTSAKIVEQSNIDCILVGDSTSMVMHGYDNTTMASMEMMVMHTRAVAKAVTKKFLVADMPFMSYRKSLEDTVSYVQQLIQAGAHAVKLEGTHGNLGMIQHIVESGVPVIGHIGLTPQFIHAFGGFKVQGKTEKAQQSLIDQAHLLEKSGCMAIVLECIPATLAKTISQQLTIPTIGIGAGPDTDGQVLVFQDLLGMAQGFQPKFVKAYLNGFELIKAALNQYDADVRACTYPDATQHTYEDNTHANHSQPA